MDLAAGFAASKKSPSFLLLYHLTIIITLLICESFSRTGFCFFQETAIPSFLDPHLVALDKLLIRPHVNSWANSLRLEKLLSFFENQPFKEESCSETVDGNREESLGLRRVNVHCNHLESIYTYKKVKVTKSESYGRLLFTVK